jgi:hypothetical protein
MDHGLLVVASSPNFTDRVLDPFYEDSVALRRLRPVILKSFVELQIGDRKGLDGGLLGRKHAVGSPDNKPSTSATRSVMSPTTAPVMSLGPPVVKLSGNLRCSSSPIAPPTRTTANTIAAKVKDPIAAPNVPRHRRIQLRAKGRSLLKFDIGPRDRWFNSNLLFLGGSQQAGA